MAYDLKEADPSVPLKERQYVKDVSSFVSSSITSCICLISQTCFSTLTAVHLSLFSEDSTYILDVKDQVLNDLVEIFGDLDELHVVGAMDCWPDETYNNFWCALNTRFCGKVIKSQKHQEGTCRAYFINGELIIEFPDS